MSLQPTFRSTDDRTFLLIAESSRAQQA